MKQKSTCRQTFQLPLWRKQVTILNATLASNLAATILNAAQIMCYDDDYNKDIIIMGNTEFYIHVYYT